MGGSITFGFNGTYTNEIIAPSDIKLISGRKNANSEEYSIEYQLLDDWNGGFSAQIVITNNTDKPMETWHLEFDYTAEIDSIWNAVIDKKESDHYSVSNAGYNAVIAPNETITIGFLGHALNSEPKNFVLQSSSADVSDLICKETTESTTESTTETQKETNTETPIDYSVDTDGDGLADIFELNIGTLINNVDTDGDGISDYYEKIYGITDPLKPDSDENGVIDANEDHDSDGLTFLEEINYATHPLKADSDSDTLSDYDEINQYGINPALWDTDTDGLNDSDDILLGFNPNLYDTDNNGICDGDEKVLQSKHVDIICEERPELIGVDVEINMSGNIADNLQVTNVLGVDTYNSSLVGLVGTPVDITCYTSFDNANITYYYDKNLVYEETAKKLGVLSYDETTGTYEDKNAVVDTEKGTVSFSTTHFCSMPMCNIEEYKTAIADVPDYITKNTFSNITWQGKVISVPEASEKFNVSQSSITAHANNKSLYILQATAVFNLKDGTTLEIPHVYLSTYEMLPDTLNLDIIFTDRTRRTIAPKNWESAYSYPINSNYNFGYYTDGTKGTLPFYDDIDPYDYGYLKDEIRYFIPVNLLDKTNTDKDDLYDVYEYYGMRMTNGELFYTDPNVADIDGDGLSDGQEIILAPGGNGLFRMVSNPHIADSDGDGIDDKNDKNPLKTNKKPDINLNTTIVFPDTEPYNDGRAYYFSAYAQNNSYDRLMNYGFDLRFYCGDNENPTESDFTITDPTELGVIVLDEAGTNFKHLLPERFAEKTWKILVDDSIDMEKLKCMAVFKADNLKNEIFSVTKAQDFIVADPEYDNKTIDAYVNDSFLNPEMRGNRAFSISASVYNYKNFSMNNVTAILTFDNPEDIEFIEDFYPADVTKSIEKIYGRKKENFNWEIRVKDGVDISSVGYTIEVTADEYDNYSENKYIDESSYNKILIDVKYGHYEVPSLRRVYVTAKNYIGKTLHISINKENGVSMLDEDIECKPNEYTYTVETLLADNTLYTVTVTADKGSEKERVCEHKIYFLPTLESKHLAEELGQIEVEEFNKHVLALCEAIAGNYNPASPSLEGIGIMIVMGYVPYLGTVLDIKDLYADIFGDVDASTLQIALDTVAVIPGGEAIKYGNALMPIVRRGGEFKILQNTLKNGDEVVGVAKKTEKGFITATFSESDKLKNIIKNSDEVADGALSNGDEVVTILKESEFFIEYVNKSGKKFKISKKRTNEIMDAIKARLTCGNEGKELEAKVANYIINKNFIVEDFASEVKTLENVAIGDIDVSTLNQIIEIKKSIGSLKITQLTKYVDPLDENYFNVKGKDVIVYIDSAIDMTKEYNIEKLQEMRKLGIIVVNSLDELGGVLK